MPLFGSAIDSLVRSVVPDLPGPAMPSLIETV
jgi:hypothetical protein